MLQQKLSPLYTYHHVGHTLDVMEQAAVIARAEGIVSNNELLLLQTAALFHDSGFTRIYNGHEAASCEIVREWLANEPYDPSEIDTICDLIMATKIPQQPGSHLACILCDADLDYLGRPDFFTIGVGLRDEWYAVGFIKTDAEWEEKQIAFLKIHRYHTAYANLIRKPAKEAHLNMLLGQPNFQLQ